jgi:transposase
MACGDLTVRMTPDRSSAPAHSLPADLVPPQLAAWLAPFRGCFTAAVWPRVLVLVAGAVLAPGQRTACCLIRKCSRTTDFCLI